MKRKSNPEGGLARLQRSLRFWLRVQFDAFASTTPILVYQMGKVGSTTVAESLRRSSLENRVFHLHHLNPTLRRDSWAAYRRAGLLNTSRSRHLIVARALSARMKWDRRTNWLVVSGFRDPIGRAVSEFFQICDWAYPEVVVDGEILVDRALSTLTREIGGLTELVMGGLNWFDRELRPIFGVNVLDHPFPRERGWTTIRFGRLRLLLYRVESLDAALRHGVPELLGRSVSLSSERANVGQEKANADANSEVLSRFRVPESVCERIYSHPTVNHFYPEALIDGFRSRWTVSRG